MTRAHFRHRAFTGILLLVVTAVWAAEPEGQPQDPALAETPKPPSVPVPVPVPVPAPTPTTKTLTETKLASRDIIERLKTIRSDIVLEEEMIRFYKVKLERIELESKINEAEGHPRVASNGSPKKPSGQTSRAAGTSSARAAPATAISAPTTGVGEPVSDLLVKAVTTRPFKEAIVTYRGRVYTVRPGDKLGPFEIKDINDSGIVTGGEGTVRSVLMGR